MFTGNEDMEATALRKQGWSISAIARHLGRDRKTDPRPPGREAGGRASASGATRSLRAVRALSARPSRARTPTSGRAPSMTRWSPSDSPRSYQSFTRGLRARELRPHCEACSRVSRAGPPSRSTIPPVRRSSGTGSSCPKLPGVATPTCWSARCRARASSGAVFCESEDQAHLIEAIDGGAAPPRRHRPHAGGSTAWPRSSIRSPAWCRTSFVPGGQALRVQVVPCPPRRRHTPAHRGLWQ